MVYLILQRFVSFALPLLLMLAISGGMAGAIHATETVSPKSEAISPASQPAPAQESFFSLKYWTAPALVAIISLALTWYLNRGNGWIADRKKEHRYRLFIREQLRWIGMPGLPGKIENIPVNLDDGTFVQLRFSDNYKDDFKNIENDEISKSSPDEIMQRAFSKGKNMLLVIGDPGSGKTTLLQYYAICALDRRKCRRLGFSKPPMVFYFPLREIDLNQPLTGNLSSNAQNHGFEINDVLFRKWIDKKTIVSFKKNQLKIKVLFQLQKLIEVLRRISWKEGE